MSKEVYSDGTIAVYRYDKNVPGESWSRAYKWKTGQEALCCYVNLCKADPCQFGERSHTSLCDYMVLAVADRRLAGW